MINKTPILLKEKGYIFDPESSNSIYISYVKLVNKPNSLDFIESQLGGITYSKARTVKSCTSEKVPLSSNESIAIRTNLASKIPIQE